MQLPMEYRVEILLHISLIIPLKQKLLKLLDLHLCPINIVSVPSMSATVGEEYNYPLIINDKNKGSLLPFKRVVKVEDLSNIRMYSINITDDVALANIDRFLGDWHNAEAIYYVDPKYPADSLVSRLNLKRYTHSVFFEDDRLWVCLLYTSDAADD